MMNTMKLDETYATARKRQENVERTQGVNFEPSGSSAPDVNLNVGTSASEKGKQLESN